MQGEGGALDSSQQPVSNSHQQAKEACRTAAQDLAPTGVRTCTDRKPPRTYPRKSLAPTSYTPLSVSFYTRALRPALFALDAERAHDLTMAALRQPLVVNALPGSRETPIDRRLSQQVFGLAFTNPVGLGAGLDKQGTAVPAWPALGFGFAEIGTVTPRPNQVIRNRGCSGCRPIRRSSIALASTARARTGWRGILRAAPRGPAPADPTRRISVGINVGKNKDTPNETAAHDYVEPSTRSTALPTTSRST